mgnify:FL=1
MDAPEKEIMKPGDDDTDIAKTAISGLDDTSGEVVFHGMGVSRGVAIGIVHRHDADTVSVAEYRIAASRVEAERARFAEAADRAARQIEVLRGKARTLEGSASEIGRASCRERV